MDYKVNADPEERSGSGSLVLHSVCSIFVVVGTKNGKMTENWINIHTHKPGAGINIVDPILGEVALPQNGKVYFSMGIHPMYIDRSTELRLEEIGKAAEEKRIVAVGEAGMDRNAPVEMGVQVKWFRRQAEIADEYHLPLIIHGVRAIPELIAEYKRYSGSSMWIMHGFNNREEILRDLLRHGFYISAGRHVMNEESHIYRLLPEIPDDRLFIETDNSDFTIAEIYRMVALRKEIAVEKLQQNVRMNFDKIFTV